MIPMQPYLQSSNGTILGVCGFGPRQLAASFLNRAAANGKKITDFIGGR